MMQERSPKNENLLLDIEQEVSEQDIDYCKKQLSKPDRIGKYSVWICIIIFALTGFFLAEAIVDDAPINNPWYSQLPFIGKYLHTEPIFTKLPLIGEYVKGSGILKFIVVLISILCGFLAGKIITALIRNGSIQDERNKRKI